jgi:hypothetical protein
MGNMEPPTTVTNGRQLSPTWATGLVCTLALMSLLPSTAAVVINQQEAVTRPSVESSYLDILEAREDMWRGIRPLLAFRLASLGVLMSLPGPVVACILRRAWIIALTFASLLLAVTAITFSLTA